MIKKKIFINKLLHVLLDFLEKLKNPLWSGRYILLFPARTSWLLPLRHEVRESCLPWYSFTCQTDFCPATSECTVFESCHPSCLPHPFSPRWTTFFFLSQFSKTLFFFLVALWRQMIPSKARLTAYLVVLAFSLPTRPFWPIEYSPWLLPQEPLEDTDTHLFFF